MIATQSRIPGHSLSLTAKAVTGGVASVAFGLLIGTLVLAFVATQFYGYRIATIQSSSMTPALNRGDLIITKPIPIQETKIGDIVVFTEGERTKLLIAHRVFNIIPVKTNVINSRTGKTSSESSTLLQTKGDANEQVDATTVDSSTFEGRVFLIIPAVGLIADRIPVQVFLLLITATTGAVWAAFEWRRHRQGQQRASEARS